LQTQPDVRTDEGAEIALQGFVEMKDVSFRYAPDARPALQNISFSLKPGETLGIVGRTGSGKTTLINLLIPELGIKTQDVSGWSGKGMHTTTFAEMHDLPFGGKIIDTPGMREFGIVHISRQELSHYYPEMRDRIQDCQFNNCLHLDEPGCAIKEAVTMGKIHVERYVSYCGILDTITEKKWR
jgi:ribosome biogenesis GTPase